MDPAAVIEVRVPSWLEPHTRRFLANRRRDVEAILVAADAGDFAAMKTLGHNLKGAGAGYGFPGISEVGREVEDAAQSHDGARLRAAAAALAGYLEAVQVTYA